MVLSYRLNIAAASAPRLQYRTYGLIGMTGFSNSRSGLTLLYVIATAGNRVYGRDLLHREV